MDFATSITKSKIWADNDCKIISLLQGTDITVHKPHLSYGYFPVLTLHLFESWKLFCTTNVALDKPSKLRNWCFLSLTFQKF